MTSKRDITTISIDSKTAKEIEQLATRFDTSKKEIISSIVEYINTQQIDPRKNETPATEFEKINKRFNQVFAFMKKQEQTYFNEMIFDLDETKQIALNHSNNFETYRKNLGEFLNPLAAQIKEIQTNVIKVHSISLTNWNNTKEAQVNISNNFQRIEYGLQKLLEHTDPKNKSGLINNLFG